jgi:hypothetical protein
MEDWNFFFFLPLALAAIGLVLWILSCVTKLAKGLKESFINLMLYSAVIRFFMAIYLKLCITFGIQMEIAANDPAHSNFRDLTIGICMLFVILGLPLAIIRTLQRSKPYLDNFQVFNKIGSLYIDLHIYKHRLNLFYYPIFLLRRGVFVLIPTLFSSMPA